MRFLSNTTLRRLICWPLALAATLALAGCVTVGPDYTRPETPASPTWRTPLEAGLSAGEMDLQALAAWWSTLGSPRLSGLIEQAVSGNLDLKSARARIREARARRGVAWADYFPSLDVSGSATQSRYTDDNVSDQTTYRYSADFDASWELDLFGGVRRSVEAADADLRASQEDLRDTLVSLLSEVALNYIEVRTYQARLAVAEQNLAAQTETYQLTSWRYQAGLSDELAVQQARYNLESTRSQIPALRTGIQQAINNIAVLLGEQPGRVNDALEIREPIPDAPSTVAVGVPANVLRRRPDVRRAERELAAQTARIGVATADLYPKFTLSGSIGLEALSLNRLSETGSRTVTGGLGFSWAIFRAGAVRQNIEIQSALQEQALVQYEAAVLDALKEVENALVAYAQEQHHRDVLRAAADAAQKAVELARGKYQAGLIDFSSVLDAERSLLSFQDQLTQSNGAVASNLVRLYKALGGGWTPLALKEEK